MRRCFGVAALVLCGVYAVWAADTDAAAKTKNDRLNVKVTVDWKAVGLREALDELSSMVKDADNGKLGKLEYKLDTGINGNQKVTFKAKDMTVAEVLDGFLGKAELGYIVVSKKGDKTDGWLVIKSGNERGTAMEGDSKTAKGKDNKSKTKEKTKPMAEEKPEVKPKPMPEEKPKEEPSADAKEKQAASKLDLIKELIKQGKKEKAKERLEELIKSFPDTKAATEAKELLDKMK